MTRACGVFLAALIIYLPARFQNRTHLRVRSDVDGIGLAKANNASRAGTASMKASAVFFMLAGALTTVSSAQIPERARWEITFSQVETAARLSDLRQAAR